MLVTSLKETMSKIFFREPWSILICNHDNEIVAHIKPPKGISWADPFPVLCDGHFYIFLEQQAVYDKGILGFIEIYDDFSHSDFIAILEKDYHLSWPNVFSVNSAWYMVPETHEHATIDLYTAVSFPHEWKFHSTLINSVDAVDSVIFYYKEKWWLFSNITNKESVRNSRLSIFCSDSFPSSDWRELPYSPIQTGLTSGRMAGRIFVDERDEYLIRPSQNCKKVYGHQIFLNRIEIFSSDAYEETTENIIYPEKNLKALGTHTFNICGSYIIRDIKIRYFSLYPFKKIIKKINLKI